LLAAWQAGELDPLLPAADAGQQCNPVEGTVNDIHVAFEAVVDHLVLAVGVDADEDGGLSLGHVLVHGDVGVVAVVHGMFGFECGFALGDFDAVVEVEALDGDFRQIVSGAAGVDRLCGLCEGFAAVLAPALPQLWSVFRVVEGDAGDIVAGAGNQAQVIDCRSMNASDVTRRGASMNEDSLS